MKQLQRVILLENNKCALALYLAVQVLPDELSISVLLFDLLIKVWSCEYCSKYDRTGTRELLTNSYSMGSRCYVWSLLCEAEKPWSHQSISDICQNDKKEYRLHGRAHSSFDMRVTYFQIIIYVT